MFPFSLSSKFIGRIRRNAAAIAAAVVVGAGAVGGPALTPARADTSSPPATPGYWLVASDGGIFSFGSARFLGSTGNIHLNQPITGMAPTPTGNGYWLVASDGGIFAFGDAGFFGSTGNIKLNKPITGMAATPTGKGYWLVASDGGIFAFGDAGFFGSTGSIKLNKPITGMSTSASGKGYRMVASDGGVFSFGDAAFFGSTGGQTLAKPISSMAPTPSGTGYWMVASDGGVFPFGDAVGFGGAPTVPSTHGPRAIAAMVPSPSGAGYWEASTTGEVLPFGDAANLGGAANLSRPIVGMAAVPRPGAGTGPAGGAVTPTPPGPAATTTTTQAPYRGAAGTFSSVASPSWGSLPDPATGRSQIVHATLEVGDRLFVAGEFTNIEDPATSPASPASPATPYLAVLDVASGAPVANSPFSDPTLQPDGVVNALAVSPDGQTLYVGGKFMKAGGGTSPRLAALDVDTGRIVGAFAPPAPNAEVHALVVNHGHLFAGGAFTTLGTEAHGLVAEFDAASGAVLPFQSPAVAAGTYSGHGGTPDPASPLPPTVHDLAVTADGSYVLAGGDFLHFGTTEATDPNGKKDGGLVALDGTTGALTPWQPVGGRPTFSLFTGLDGTTIFAATGGGGGVGTAFVPGSPTPLWTNNVDGDATGIVATATTAYLVGHFNHAGIKPTDPCLVFTPTHNVNCPNGTHNNHLVAFDAKTGFLDTTFTAQADTNKGPDDASMGAHRLYVGGDFNGVADSVTGACTNHAIVYCKSYRAQPGLAVYPGSS
jgi:hypothetical protein